MVIKWKIIPCTLDAKVVKFKPCNLKDVLHILKELEYAQPIIPPPEAYYFLYRFQTCVLVGFAPPMLNAHILVDVFKRMWKIKDKELWELLPYNVLWLHHHQWWVWLWSVGTSHRLYKCICTIVVKGTKTTKFTRFLKLKWE
jgi:hypothetical protein